MSASGRVENDGTWMYFEIAPGQTLDAIKEWEASVLQCRQAAEGFAEEIGADPAQLWRDSRQNIVGFTFLNIPAKGFKHYAKDPHGMFRPDGRTKLGKEFKKRMESFRPISVREVQRKIGPTMVLSPHSGSRTGLALCSSHWEIIDGVYVAKIPVEKDGKFVPHQSLKPLSLSEVFQMRKKAEEKEVA